MKINPVNILRTIHGYGSAMGASAIVHSAIDTYVPLKPDAGKIAKVLRYLGKSALAGAAFDVAMTQSNKQFDDVKELVETAKEQVETIRTDETFRDIIRRTDDKTD